MALELRQQLRLSQQLIMTPQLQMAIKLLQLSRLELMDVIRQELEENPGLEEVQEGEPAEGSLERSEPESSDTDKLQEVSIEERVPDDMDWSNYMEEYNAPGQVYTESEEKDVPRYESFVARRESLYDHILWQVMLTFSEGAEQQIGCMIAGNLNRDGYLEESVEEIAHTGDFSPSKVQEVLTRMQTFDPVGVCARNLSECLLLQVRYLGIEQSVVTKIISNHLNHLQNKNYRAIAQALQVPLREVIEAVDIITGLEPKPGRQFSDEEPQYITPDIFVYKLGDDYEIVLNDDGLPKLRVSVFYKKTLSDAARFSEEARGYIQDKLRSAAWLIRSIHQRQRTIYRVMENIVKFQREFMDKGIAYLKPMVLRDVAEEIGMHESTISRVTTNKYAHTPQGIFELKYFFNSSINRVTGGTIASASVKDKIFQIVKGEDPSKPFSDDRIVQLLEKENIKIARRTVAKYREVLGILPSSKRRRYH